MRRDWEPEQLIDYWTLVEADWELIASKAGATRLEFALLLKFFELSNSKATFLAMPATCDALLARCRAERVEPPGPSRIERVLGTARASSEQRFTALITSRRRFSASSTGQTVRAHRLARSHQAPGGLLGRSQSLMPRLSGSAFCPNSYLYGYGLGPDIYDVRDTVAGHGGGFAF